MVTGSRDSLPAPRLDLPKRQILFRVGVDNASYNLLGSHQEVRRLCSAQRASVAVSVIVIFSTSSFQSPHCKHGPEDWICPKCNEFLRD
jgi:hypothetical protein